MSYQKERRATAQRPTTTPLHTMTREDVLDTCAEHPGVYVILTATQYQVIYECAVMATATRKAEAIAAANVLANDHMAAQDGAEDCPIFDYTATPITEEDIPR